MVERQHGRAPWASLSPAWPRCPPGTCPRSPGLPARAPPPPGWGWSPSRSGGWHKLAPTVQIQPVCTISRSPVSVQMSFWMMRVQICLSASRQPPAIISKGWDRHSLSYLKARVEYLCSKLIRTFTGDLEMMHRLAESGLRVPACASLLSGMETSPSQGVEVPVLADQDFEDMFLADTQSRLGRGTLREHDPVASLPSTIWYQDHSETWFKMA